MKATIEIDDELYRRVKAAAAMRGRKVKDLVAEGLRIVLRSSHSALPARRIQLPIVKSKKPGTLRLSNERIAEVEARLDSGNELVCSTATSGWRWQSIAMSIIVTPRIGSTRRPTTRQPASAG